MGLVEKVKGRLAAEAVKRFLGRDGMKWLNENKRLVGAILAGVAAAAASLGYTEAAGLVALVASYLGVAGATKSDAEAKRQ